MHSDWLVVNTLQGSILKFKDITTFKQVPGSPYSRSKETWKSECFCRRLSSKIMNELLREMHMIMRDYRKFRERIDVQKMDSSETIP